MNADNTDATDDHGKMWRRGKEKRGGMSACEHERVERGF